MAALKQSWVPGMKCWAPDEETAFVMGVIKDVSGKKVQVQLTHYEKQIEVQERQLLPRTGDSRCVADMDELQELHVASVLQNVEVLFGQSPARSPGTGVVPIYSSVGPVLIAMNPFERLPIYEQEWVKAYHEASGNIMRNKQLGPHCYKTVEETYANLRVVKNQAVIICGESGAGKTVTNRKMIDYLCEVAKPKSKQEQAEIGVNPEAISDANVLLEAFGNAKTTRNDNSSRFGKYTKLSFLPENDYILGGCTVDHYLLERSRVVAPNSLERNYHIFYQILAGNEAEKYGLGGKNREDFSYTKNTSEVKSVDDSVDYTETLKQLKQSGFPEEMRVSIMKVVSGVLLLGNVEFTNSEDACEVTPASKGYLDKACKLLQVNSADLAKSMVNKVITVPNSDPIWKQLGTKESVAQRDTVAKTLYSRMFDKIVTVIGQRLNKKGTSSKGQGKAEIGLLDIFGFEDMPINGFEQLFINLTNERIQLLFNSIMFERELEVYKAEGIAKVFDPGTDNLATVQLFTSSKPPGIVKQLTESCLMNGSDGQKFVSKMNKVFEKHASYKMCTPQDAQKMARKKGLKSAGRGAALEYRENFMVNHYAGEIMYTVQNWVPKNRDSLFMHISDVLAESELIFVSDMFDQDEGGKSTVGEKFVTQLEVLSTALEKGESLFVRCIKSNPQMVPGLVDRKMVLEQLVNGGVIAALEMRHRGLPDRMEYVDFVHEFGNLSDKKDAKKEPKVQTERLCIQVFGEEAKDSLLAFGHTKLFMKSVVSSFLRALASTRNRYFVKKVQRQWRSFMGTAKVHQVNRSWASFQETEKLAKQWGLQGVAMVDDALFQANVQIHPMKELLDQLKAKHGADIEKIAKGLPTEKTTLLHNIAQKSQQAVDKAIVLKQEAEQLLGQQLSRAMRHVAELLTRVKNYSADCEGLEDMVEKAVLDEFKSAVDIASNRLQDMQSKEISAFKAAGVGTSFVDKEGNSAITEGDVSPGAVEMLANANALVENVAEHAAAIAKLKVDFKAEAAEAIVLHEETDVLFDALSGQSTRFVAEGMSEVVDMVSEALKLKYEANDLLTVGRDVDGYKKVIEEYSSAVKAAQDMFERMAAELQRREQEKSIRAEVQQSLDHLQEKLAGCQKDVQNTLIKVMDDVRGISADKDLEGYLQEIASLSYSELDLKVWQTQVEALISKVSKEIQKVYKMMADAKAERKGQFDRKFSIFNKQAKEEEPAQFNPTSFIEAEGAVANKPDLMDVHDAVGRLADAGASRSSVTRCIGAFVKHHFGSAGANTRRSFQMGHTATNQSVTPSRPMA